jgi:hypothetical protein
MRLGQQRRALIELNLKRFRGTVGGSPESQGDPGARR